MSSNLVGKRFNKAAFIEHLKPWINPSGTPGDWYLTFEGKPVTWQKLQEVADLGYPRGPWLLTLEEVFKNYYQSSRSGRYRDPPRDQCLH